MRSVNYLVVLDTLLAILLATCYGNKQNLLGCKQQIAIEQFMKRNARIWFYFTSRVNLRPMCIRDNVHNVTNKAIAFIRTEITKTEYEQDFFVEQFYARLLDPTFMVLNKTNGQPRDKSAEMLVHLSRCKTCAVFFVWSLTGGGRHWCDLRVRHVAIKRGPTRDCYEAFERPPCNGKKKLIFTDLCRI
ncbi:uncharacterized protein LOC144142230 [Haemaphysalis longicornis]